MSKKNTPAPAAKPTKDKAGKFVELAQKRTTKAINAMRSIRGLSNRSNYEYTAEQTAKIVAALKSELEQIHDAFTRVDAVKKEGFTL